jgi:hypothetical protein
MTNRLGSRTAGRTGARAVVPDYWIAVDESSGCIEFGLSSRDANEGELSREQVNDFINNTDTSFRLVGVYASPTPPASEHLWSRFASYLLDHCEGEKVSEEMLQQNLSRMLAETNPTASEVKS